MIRKDMIIAVIFAGVDNAIIGNNGTINATGDRVYGIYGYYSDSSYIDVSGSITTSGRLYGYGVHNFYSDGSTINVSGDITTSGQYGLGVCNHYSDGSTINVSGDITTSGKNGYGIAVGNNNSINISTRTTPLSIFQVI